MINKYVFRSRISEVRFREIIKHFVLISQPIKYQN